MLEKQEEKKNRKKEKRKRKDDNSLVVLTKNINERIKRFAIDAIERPVPTE